MRKRLYRDHREKDEDYANLMIEIADRLGIPLKKLSRQKFSDLVDIPNARTWAWRRGWGTCKKIALEVAAQRVDAESHPSIFDSWDDDDEDTLVDVAMPQFVQATLQPEPEPVRRYVVTWAQNVTPLHDDFFTTLLNYCRVNDAELIVIPGRYRNPTSIWNENNKKDDRWDVRLEPYLMDEPRAICRDLVIHGEIKTQPTAVTPLTGYESYGKTTSIFGHPKLQLMTIPGHTAAGTRTFITTSAVTIQNYTPTRAGMKAHSRHVIGALVVENQGQKYFMRHINASTDGAFTDLDRYYDQDDVTAAPPAAALVCGDLHAPLVDRAALHATWGASDSMTATLRPERLVLHDMIAFRARSHHERNNPDHLYEAHHTMLSDSVEGEIARAVDIVRTIPEGPEVIEVASNHDEHLDRWLREVTTKADPANALLFHELQAEKLRRFERDGAWTPALQIAFERLGCNRVRFLRRDESYSIQNIELAFHGDVGIGGTRGSVAAYAKLATKTVVGHYHSPTIRDGCYAVGMLGDFDQKYNLQPSTWDRANCVIYANGKRAMLFIRDGQWRIG